MSTRQVAPALPSTPAVHGNSNPLNTCRSQPGSGCNDPAADTQQFVHAPGLPAGRVRARGRIWTVAGITPHPTCASVRLAPADAAVDSDRTLIVPFDRLRPQLEGRSWCRAGRRTAARAVARHVLAGSVLRGAARLHPDLAVPAWQLVVPSLLAAGGASRVLLADAVGLGKTIQAGFTVTALRGLTERARVLVLTPASLCDQWTTELSRLFGLQPLVVDAAGLTRLRRSLPPGVNPWSLPRLAVASVDFVKQPEVLAGVLAATWDLLVIDEAHHLGPATDRYDAAHAIGARTPFVLLLTATPHGGADEGYEALRALGAVGNEPPAVVVRRTRADVGVATIRRVHVLRCRPTAAERRLWRALRAYAGCVWASAECGAAPRLAMTVLLKRAASSAAALGRSVACRSRALAGEPLETQPALPFDDDAGEHDDGDEALDAALGVPGLGDLGREREWLHEIERLAAAAAAVEAKPRALARLLRRTREPVVVFTEYRDTLRHLEAVVAATEPVALLHGGLSRLERRDALAAFLDGHVRVLLATDVGSEGLNLHLRARTVVSVEVPWSPVRLEQRVGRVDRIGQRRPVHGITLVSASGPEHHVLGRLSERVRRIRRALGEAGDLPPDDDLELAAHAIGAAHPSPRRPVHEPAPATTGAFVPEAEAAVLAAAHRLLTARLAGERAAGDGRRRRVPWARLRGGWPPRAIVIVFEVCSVTARGTTAASVLVPIQIERANGAVGRVSPAVLLRSVTPIAAETAAAAASARLVAAEVAHRSRVTAALERLERLLAVTRTEIQAAPLQPGLFDRRALAAEARRVAAGDLQLAALDDRRRRLLAELQVRMRPPRPIAAFVGR